MPLCMMCEPEDGLTEDVPSIQATDVSSEEMSPMDYATFVGYICGFMAFFYGIAFVFAPDSLAN